MGRIKGKNSRYTFLDKLLIIISIGAAIALFLSSFAGNFDPRKYTLMAFLGLAYPFILLGNLLLLVWWVIRAKWFWTIIIVLVIVLGFDTLQSTFKLFGELGGDEKEANHLRVLTYNVHNFKRYGDDNDLQTKRNFLDLIKKENADVLFFQEFYTRFKGEYNLKDSLEKRLGFKYSYFISNKENEYEARGLAIFSKHPLSDKDFIPFDASGSNGCLSANIRFQNKTIRLYNVHLKSISFNRKDYDYIEKVTASGPDKQSSKRILRMLKSAFQKRAENVDLLKEEFAKLDGPFILAGDFNDTPASYSVKQLTGDLNNAFKKKGMGLGITYNGKFPNFQIDYIATTKDLKIINYKVTRERLSDHYPVRSDLELL